MSTGNDVPTSNKSKMGSRNFGGDDPISTIGTTQPDEIQINRGTRGRVGAVGCL
jgi:hypothetical protein